VAFVAFAATGADDGGDDDEDGITVVVADGGRDAAFVEAVSVSSDRGPSDVRPAGAPPSSSLPWLLLNADSLPIRDNIGLAVRRPVAGAAGTRTHGDTMRKASFDGAYGRRRSSTMETPLLGKNLGGSGGVISVGKCGRKKVE